MSMERNSNHHGPHYGHRGAILAPSQPKACVIPKASGIFCLQPQARCECLNRLPDEPTSVFIKDIAMGSPASSFLNLCDHC
jgi:hypothetical protein